MATVAELRAVAEAAATRGWSVFPLWPGTKIPALHSRSRCPGTGACRDEHRGWEQRATTDGDHIRWWWSSRPFNVGIATGPSGLVVLDLDVPKPGQTPPPPWNQPGVTCGADVLLLVCEQAGQPPPFDTYTVTTPSGGTHLYYRAPAGVRIRTTVGQARRTAGRLRRTGLGWKIDTRAVGGQVLAAGSLIGPNRYELVNDAAVMQLPSWLASRLSTPPPFPRLHSSLDVLVTAVRSRSNYAAAALRGEVERVLDSEEGCRNDTLNLASYVLGHRVREGLIPFRLAYDALVLAGTAVGLSEQECQRTVQSGLSAGERNR